MQLGRLPPEATELLNLGVRGGSGLAWGREHRLWSQAHLGLSSESCIFWLWDRVRGKSVTDFSDARLPCLQDGKMSTYLWSLLGKLKDLYGQDAWHIIHTKHHGLCFLLHIWSSLYQTGPKDVLMTYYVPENGKDSAGDFANNIQAVLFFTIFHVHWQKWIS